jgi:hypothetical protein
VQARLTVRTKGLEHALRTKVLEHARVQEGLAVMIWDEGCKETEVCKHNLL